jgi:hypothetical protein
VVDLLPVPHEQSHLVVCGTSVRKPASILAPYLRSLAWQVVPRNVRLVYLFVDDGCEPDARALLDAFVQEHTGQVFTAPLVPIADFSDTHFETHQWSDSAMQRVGRHKDLILNTARDNRAEAVWLCDADLICDPYTLTSLWSVPEQIVCGVYWTRWQRVTSEMNPVHAGPQVWQVHPYGLSGNGMEEWELRRKLIHREVVHVYGQGACTLIRRDALLRGVSFAPMPGNTGPGLMQGEDRHFCLRAEMLHLRMVADGWPDIFHIYHRPDDEALIPEMVTRLGPREDEALDIGTPKPGFGDLVSLEIQAMEPVPMNGGWMHPPMQYVRGRIGQLRLHPELEGAVVEMSRGETRIVPCHFGLDYPFPPYRGQRRLLRVRVIDHKPHGYPPGVIEEELLRNTVGGVLDTVTLSPELVEQLREVHA